MDALKRVEKAIVVAAPEVPGLVAFVVVRVARAKKAAADRPRKAVAVLAKKVEPAKRVERAKRVDVSPSRNRDCSSQLAVQFRKVTRIAGNGKDRGSR
ncbi:MAG: hypothetical protein CMJ50_00575, partial [Planctomycetaceae bacterium]|nr:hypothetical protein [Planctomycetaceae bacterium]